MLTITTVAIKQSEEKEQEENFNQSTASWEIFDWVGQGAAILELTITGAEAPEREV